MSSWTLQGRLLWLPVSASCLSRSSSYFKKKKKIKSNKANTVSQSELNKRTHLAPRSNWTSRFALLKRKLASLASKQSQSGEINTEDAKS